MNAVQRTAGLAVLVSACVFASSAQADVLMAVSEGTSGSGNQITQAQIAAKYKPLSDTLARALGEPVNVVYVRDFAVLAAGMRDGRFGLVLARPSDYPARGVRDHGYNAVATAEPQGQCLLVVKQDSPYKTLDDLKGKPIILPEAVAYMARFCSAELRDRGLLALNPRITYVKEQAIIPFALKNGIKAVGGIASYSGVAKKLDELHLRVLHKSVQQPYMPLIANGRLGTEKVQAMQRELAAFNATDEGKAALKTWGATGFDTKQPQERLMKLLAWIEK